MAVDEAFRNAGQKVGLEIWRIEKLQVVAQDQKTFGEFFSGDSYIVLSTKQLKNSPKFEWDLHFWLGRDTTHDEKGVAAYKTVELDDSLGGAPVQHREVQGHESKLFLSYFKHGVKYLEGGVDSGFKKVDRDSYQVRLLHVKGKKDIRVHQVKCHVSSLNQGDVFILDCGLVIFVWNGPASSRMERHKAAEVARRIKDEERGGRAEVKIVEERWQTDIAFFKALGSSGNIAKAGDVQGDQEFEKSVQEETKLFRVSDASGKLEVTEVGSRTFMRDNLDSNDCFILDSGQSGIYVWIGKGCTKNEKKSAWKNATDFLQLRGYPDWTPMTRVVEGGETPLFKQHFTSWSLDDTTHVKTASSTMEKAYTNHHTPTKKVIEPLTDNATGNNKPKSGQRSSRLFHCYNSEGRFCIEELESCSQDYLNNDSVVILDTKETVYLWTGKHVKSLEAKTCLKNVMESFQAGGGHRAASSQPFQHVRQGDEPPGFTKHFRSWRADKCKSPVQVSKKFPYSDLTKRLPPVGVDPACKEAYLTDKEFLEVFGMPYNQFLSLKPWQQVELKKKTGLF